MDLELKQMFPNQKIGAMKNGTSWGDTKFLSNIINLGRLQEKRKKIHLLGLLHPFCCPLGTCSLNWRAK